MTDVVIKGGTGSGLSAGVAPNNRFLTDSVTHTGEFASAVGGRAFFANTQPTADTLTVTATGGYMLTLQNTSTIRTLLISAIFVSADVAAGVVAFERNPTLGSLSNNTAMTPVNLNFQSGNSAEATVNIWDEVSNGIDGVTAGDVLGVHVLGQGINVFPVDESFILGSDDIFAIRANSTSTTDEMAFDVRFHYVKNELLGSFTE